MSINAKVLIKDRLLLYKSVSVVLITILGFVFHQFLKLEPAFIAVVAAGFLIVITKINVISSLKNVEWSVIIFFISLFIMVGTLDKTGIIDRIAKGLNIIIGGGTPPSKTEARHLVAAAQQAFVSYPQSSDLIHNRVISMLAALPEEFVSLLPH